MQQPIKSPTFVAAAATFRLCPGPLLSDGSQIALTLSRGQHLLQSRVQMLVARRMLGEAAM